MTGCGLRFGRLTGGALGVLFALAAGPAQAEPPMLAPRAEATRAEPVQRTGVAAHSLVLTPRPAGASLALEFSENTPFQVSILSQPDRIVIDLPKVAFAATRGAGKAGASKAGAAAPAKIGPVSAYRYGLFIADRSRIVLDLAEPALVERIDRTDADGRHRVIFHFARADRAKFAEQARKDAARRLADQAPQSAIAFGGTPPRAAAGQRAPTEKPMVVLDPGHGGLDPGASTPDGDNEKTIVLALALAVKERLEKAGQVQVAMTRSGDAFVGLNDRVRFARDRKAELMVSFHADTLAHEAGVRGASIYTLSEKASDVISARLAESENKADQIAGLEPNEDAGALGDILFDLTKRETRHFSGRLARTLGETLPRATGMHKNPLRGAGFRVLTAPDVPSVLIETGYLSSTEDARLMKSAEWRNAMAESVALAIEKYVGENATRVLNSAARP